MSIFYVHAGAMGAGFLLMIGGVVIAMSQRKQRWWLKTHKAAVMTGLVVILTGLAAAFLMVGQEAGGHFRVPHAAIGLAMVLSASVTLVLGTLLLRIREKAGQLRGIHHWSGRMTLAIGVAAILSGLMAAGII
jgi:hypothetical protein